MPQEQSRVSYIEIGSKDADRSRDFFGQLFGWTFHPMAGGPQGWFDTPSMKAGLHDKDPQPAMTVFFRVSDLSEAVEKVRELGGEADDPGAEEPGFGRFSICRDPQGTPFGLHQP